MPIKKKFKTITMNTSGGSDNSVRFFAYKNIYGIKKILIIFFDQ